MRRGKGRLRSFGSRALGCLLLSCGLTGCDSDTVELAGIVERKVLELAAPISEVIVELPVAENERVAADQVVVQLDVEVSSAELRACEAANAASAAALVEAEGDLKRQQDLRRSRVAAQQALDAAQRQRDEALAVVAEKAARTAQARRKLNDLTIRSRLSGFVDQLPYELGERVPAGGVVAVVMADENPWVRVWLPARAVARVGVGSAAEIRVEGLEGSLRGTLSHIAREPEFTPHYALTERESAHLVYESRVLLEDAPDDLRPGLPAQVRIPLKP